MSAALCALTMLLGAGMAGCRGTITRPPPNLTQGQWVANFANVVEFIPQLPMSGVNSPPPRVAINSSVFGAPQGVVFNKSGGLWVIDGGTVFGGGTVPSALFFFTKFQLTQLKTNPTPTPTVTINSDEFVFPQQAVFDAAGNLWVSDNGANEVFVFSPAQLAAGGADVTPTIELKSTPAFKGPLGIAFSTAGNLWVANNGGNTLFEFDAGDLAGLIGAVTLVPDVILSSIKGSINKPWALAFDKKGNLWSSNMGTSVATSSVVEFAASVLGTTGAPTPAVTLTSATVSGHPSLDQPNGIAFNNVGGLAVVNSAGNSISNFGKGSLGKSGSPTPGVLIIGTKTTLHAPAGNTFGIEVK